MENKEKKELEENIDKEKKRIKGYDELQLEVDKLTGALNKCLEIVGLSVADPIVNAKLNDYQQENERLRKRATDKIRSDIRVSNNNIKDYSNKINELSKEEKKS